MFDFEKISLEQLERAMLQEREGEGTYKSVIKQGHINSWRAEEGSLR